MDGKSSCLLVVVLLVVVVGCTQAPAPQGKDGAAFPMHYRGDYASQGGMSLRDYFAAHAPPSPYYDPKEVDSHDAYGLEAQWRWNYADAMMQLRQKSKLSGESIEF